MSLGARLTVLCGGLCCVGCLPRGSATPDTAAPVVLPEDNPAFVSLEVTCDAEAGQWIIDAETERWSNGMTGWFTIDGTVVERHRIPVVESAPDGAWDKLRKVLPIVSDWREAQNGVSTSFLCAEAVSSVYWLENPLGAQIQCRQRGPNPELFESLDNAPHCPEQNR